MRKLCIISVFLAAILAFTACDTINEGIRATLSPIAVTDVFLKASTSLAVGGIETLTATITPSNATNKNVTWESDNADIATVAEGGVVTGIKAGTATITVITVDGGKTASCNVTVSNAIVSVTDISLNKTSTSLIVGGTETLIAIIEPSDATNQNVTWMSADISVATVSGGIITAVSDGTVAIIVTTVDGGKTAFCNVTVSAIAIPVTDISINKESTGLTVGNIETLFAEITPRNATNQNVRWTSSNPTVASVSMGGEVFARDAGFTVITVTAVDGGFIASCTVSVGAIAIPVTSISINKESAGLTVGDFEILFAEITPSDATNQSVRWNSSDTAVATVSAGGEVFARSAGTTTISVTTVDGGYIASCIVTIGAPFTIFNEKRYQADPYTGTDKIKYSYSYNGYDFYYIYLGQLKFIPLFSSKVLYLSPSYTSRAYKFLTTDATEITVSEAVSKSSQETLSISNEHTVSKTTEYKFHEEVNAGFKIFGIGTEVKFAADQNFKNYTSDTSHTDFIQTTSLTNTVEYATSKYKSLQVEETFTLTRDDREGFYRYTCFTNSAVYLWVVRNSKGEIYYEFRECISLNDPRIFYWDLDYSEDGVFGKNDLTRFEIDMSILNNLPVSAVDLSDGTLPPIGIEIHPTGVSLNKTSISLAVGGTETLYETIIPSNATNKDVRWSSGNVSVVEVSLGGVVIAKNIGNTTITVTTVDGVYIATCTVTVIPASIDTGFIVSRRPSPGDNVTITNSGRFNQVFDQVSFEEFRIDINKLKSQGYKTISFYFRLSVREYDDMQCGMLLFSSPAQSNDYLVDWFNFEHTAGKKDTTWWTHDESELYFKNVPLDKFSSYFVIRYGAVKVGSGSGSWAHNNLRIKLVIEP